MDIRIKDDCPQCGASVEISESDYLLKCPFCRTNNFLVSTGPFRYLLPLSTELLGSDEVLYAPYLRFKGNIFLVTEKGITHRSVDTTQAGSALTSLPPSLGLRPQAMRLQRLAEQEGRRYLKLDFKASEVLEKAAAIGDLTIRSGQELFHRAFIGETVSFIYLPIVADDERLRDGVTGYRLSDEDNYSTLFNGALSYQPRWRVGFQATLCPKCGGHLDGEGDSVVLGCDNCGMAWEFGDHGLQPISWKIVHGDERTAMYLGFWCISAQIPDLDLYSYADFLERTNQPFIPKPQWREQELRFWIPAVKLSPSIFLRAAKHMTIAQWRVTMAEGAVPSGTPCYPVTLPSSEARQSIKITLAAAGNNRRKIYTSLAGVRIKNVKITLVYLPFADNSFELVQPQSLTVIPKNVLWFGRSM